MAHSRLAVIWKNVPITIGRNGNIQGFKKTFLQVNGCGPYLRNFTCHCIKNHYALQAQATDFTSFDAQ